MRQSTHTLTMKLCSIYEYLFPPPSPGPGCRWALPRMSPHASPSLLGTVGEAAALEERAEQVSGQRAPPGWHHRGAGPARGLCSCPGVCRDPPGVRAAQKGTRVASRWVPSPSHLHSGSQAWAAPWERARGGRWEGCGGLTWQGSGRRVRTPPVVCPGRPQVAVRVVQSDSLGSDGLVVQPPSCCENRVSSRSLLGRKPVTSPLAPREENL